MKRIPLTANGWTQDPVSCYWSIEVPGLRFHICTFTRYVGSERIESGYALAVTNTVTQAITEFGEFPRFDDAASAAKQIVGLHNISQLPPEHMEILRGIASVMHPAEEKVTAPR